MKTAAQDAVLKMSHLLIIYIVSLFLCFIIAFINYKNLKNNLKLIFYYVTINLLVESVGIYSQYLSFNKDINIHIFNVQAIFEFILIGLFFSKILEFKNKTLVLNGLIILITFYYGLVSIYSKNTLIANYQYFVISNILLIILSIKYFSQFLEKNNDLWSHPQFWIVTGILFFNSGFFFLSGLINYIAEKDRILAKMLFQINYIINIFYYSLITYGFICQRNLAKSS